MKIIPRSMSVHDRFLVARLQAFFSASHPHRNLKEDFSIAQNTLGGIPFFTIEEMRRLEAQEEFLKLSPLNITFACIAFEVYFPNQGVERFIKALKNIRSLGRYEGEGLLIEANREAFEEALEKDAEGLALMQRTLFTLTKIHYGAAWPTKMLASFIVATLLDPIFFGEESASFRTYVNERLDAATWASVMALVVYDARLYPKASYVAGHYMRALYAGLLQELIRDKEQPWLYLLEELAPLLLAGVPLEAIVERERHPEPYEEMPVAWWAPLATSAAQEGILSATGRRLQDL